MASQLVDMATASAIATCPKPVDRAEAVDAVRRLAGALSADVLIYDRLAGALRPAVTSARPLDLTCPALVEAVQIQTGMMLGDPRPRWVTPNGQGAASFVLKLSDRGARSFFLVLGFADASSIVRARMTRLGPDLATLIRFHVDVGHRLQELEEVGAVATAALEHGECGVIAVRADRSMVMCNATAAAFLEDGVGLQVRRGRICATEGKKFDAALGGILDQSPEQGDGRPPATVLLLKRAGGARPVVAVIAPVRPDAATTKHGTDAAALLYVVDPSHAGLRGLETLCQLHGLSGVESRLLINLTDGLTLADAAAKMRIKLETARTYLKQIFAKTGTHRQTDLTALMMRYLRAFRGDFDFQPA